MPISLTSQRTSFGDKNFVLVLAIIRKSKENWMVKKQNVKIILVDLLSPVHTGD